MKLKGLSLNVLFLIIIFILILNGHQKCKLYCKIIGIKLIIIVKNVIIMKKGGNKMSYKSINCGDINGKKDSSKLVGALSTNQDFFYMNTIRDEIGPEDEFTYSPIAVFLPKDISVDYENDLFIGEAGAVADAYNFNNLSEEEKQKEIQFIIAEKQAMYPEYEFVILPGKFPIDVEGGLTLNNELIREARGIMSSHILYITDYQNHLQSTKNKSL